MSKVQNSLLVRRITRVMTRKPARLNLSFIEENKITAEDIISKLPMFQARNVTVDDIAAAISADSDGRLSMTDGVITLVPKV